MDKDAPMEEDRVLLFILEDPVVHLDNGEQAKAILVVCFIDLYPLTIPCSY